MKIDKSSFWLNDNSDTLVKKKEIVSKYLR